LIVTVVEPYLATIAPSQKFKSNEFLMLKHRKFFWKVNNKKNTSFNSLKTVMFLKHIEYKVSSFALFKKGTLALPDENVPVAVDADTRAGIDSKKSRLRGHG
jgi:hypothetical protein